MGGWRNLRPYRKNIPKNWPRLTGREWREAWYENFEIKKDIRKRHLKGKVENHKNFKINAHLLLTNEEKAKNEKINERLERCKAHSGRPPRTPAPGAPMWSNDEEE